MKFKHFVLATLLMGLLSSCTNSNVSSSSTISVDESSDSSTNQTSSNIEPSSSSQSSSDSSSSSLPPSPYPCPEIPQNNLYTPLSSDKLDVYALEMKGNYGDSTLFKYGNFEMLVDGGTPNSSTIINQALQTYVTDGTLEMLVLTHPHNDHYGSINSRSVFTNAGINNVNYIIDNGADTYNSSYENGWVKSVRQSFVSSGALYYPIKALVNQNVKPIFHICDDLTITFLDTGYYIEPGSNGATGNPNSNSVAFSLRAGTYDFVMVGDLPSDGEAGLMKKNPDVTKFIPSGDKVIYKAAHHGSNGGSSNEFMDYLKPTYGWASAGITSKSQTSSGPIEQHPYKNARARIEEETGIDNFYWNGTAGTLDFSFPHDFSSLSITGLGRTQANYYDYQTKTIVDPDSEKNTPLEKTRWAAKGV
jgi:beta-lactamase superfamily II metal-dependent hydrolase